MTEFGIGLEAAGEVGRAVTVTLTGCDDHNDIDLTVTEGELAFLHRLAEASEQACGFDVCKPVLSVEEQ